MSYELVVIGASWGGLRALEVILPSLPADYPAAVVVVQHRRFDSPRDAMANLLADRSALPVCEIEDKMEIKPGGVYLAPADYHVIIEEGHFALSTEEFVDFARPSVDVLFETASDSYGSSVIAVVLTGLMDDGSRGIRCIKQAGGYLIAQHPDSAERPAMPQATIDTGLVDRVLALGDIGPALTELAPSPSQEKVR